MVKCVKDSVLLLALKVCTEVKILKWFLIESKKNLFKEGYKGIRMQYSWLRLVLKMLPGSLAMAGNETTAPPRIDASDPTRIVSFIGIGPKVTRFTDGSNISELRLSGTLSIGKKDMVTIEAGYGRHDGENENGIASTQLRHFHLFQMDQVERGYRGWGSSIDLNLAGSLKGMDGQNTLGLGASPAFALGGGWQLYPITMLLNSWDKKFSRYNGGGINLSPLLAKRLEWWDGAFLIIWPQYNRFYWGALKGNGGGRLQLTLGGKFTETLIWKLTYDDMFDKYFRAYTSEDGFDEKADRAMFFRVESYF